jgi:hypothetical protein
MPTTLNDHSREIIDIANRLEREASDFRNQSSRHVDDEGLSIDKLYDKAAALLCSLNPGYSDVDSYPTDSTWAVFFDAWSRAKERPGYDQIAWMQIQAAMKLAMVNRPTESGLFPTETKL